MERKADRGSPQVKGLVRAEGLSVNLGTFPVLEKVAFALHEKEFMAVVGPNGSGKSTLLKTILGLIPKSEGTLDVIDKTTVGYVPQLKNFDRSFPAIALELVMTATRHRWPWTISGRDREGAFSALSRAGAHSLAHRSIESLSGGELQRVYLARAFAREPKLILLDEPATGVDFRGEFDLHHILHEEKERSGCAFIMVTHDLEVAAHHADRVLLLNRRSIAYGPPNEVLTQENMDLAFSHVGHVHSRPK